ncbi:MAG: hypothetical protein SGPRY_012960 [Prymnesium sp.]
MAPRYCRGDRVQVFYRANADPGGYFPVPNLAAGCLRPRFGRTDGWIDALVEADWPPVDASLTDESSAERYPRIRIRHTHSNWSNRHGERLNPDEDSDMVLWMDAADVRHMGPDVNPVVSLSVLVVRWGGEQTQFNVEQASHPLSAPHTMPTMHTSASVSDEYISCFLDETLYGHLGPDYEVFTVFVQSGEDMSKLMPPSIAAAMTGRHRQGPSHEVTWGEGWYFKLALRRCAAYFLWPVMATDGEGEQSGMVHQVRPFRSLTSTSAPVFFPSRAHRKILRDRARLRSERHLNSACLLPRFHIPPVTTVNRASVVADPLRAARSAIAALDEIRALRYGEPENEVRRCLVHLHP